MSYITSVTVCPSSISLAVGEWFYASVCVCPYGGDSDVIWSSCDPSVASVSEGGGYIYANSVGSTYICATAQDGSGHKSCMYVQVTEKVPIESISLKYTSLLIEKGYGRSISGYISPSNATNKNLNWSSSNTGVATVTNGYVTAINKGNATITATAADGKGATASCLITVTTNKLVTDITVNPSSKELKLRDSMFLGATVCPKDAVNRTITWSSDDTSIATVNEQSGLVTTHKGGQTTIRATSNDGSKIVGRCELTVKPPIYVSHISLSPSSANINLGKSKCFCAKITPSNAENKNLRWYSSNPAIATVNADGCVTAKAQGTTTICAAAKDGSGVHGYCEVTVQAIPVTSIKISSNISVEIGKSKKITSIVYPSNATNQSIKWSSEDASIATVTSSGTVTGKKAGITTITATTSDGGHISTCEIWVNGKIPVFLIHGRTSNSFGVWGANNSIFTNPLDPDEKDNNHSSPSISAISAGDTQCLYTSKSSQDLFSYQLGKPITVNGILENQFTVPSVFNGEFADGKYTSTHSEGGNLAYYLKQQGYKENINLFVFNYPNEDAVVYGAEKFQKYIENLIEWVYNNGKNEMKTCFFESRNAYNTHKFRFNIVGHSMGGLVGRYFIENLDNDIHVKKLITICTPHWGSGYADTSCVIGTDSHKICDHDLRFDSAMYGGTFSTMLNCNAITTNCYNGNYILTNTLHYSQNRSTKYYAIAAIDYKPENINSNNYTFEIPNDLHTYQSLVDYMTSKSVHKTNIFSNIVPIDLHEVGDNMVGLLSQIGWTENNTTSPNKKILMEKIFIDVDANGENGNNIPVMEMLNMLHNKAPHRICIMEQVNKYLNE